MKDQINKYARGVFDYEFPRLESQENSITAIVDKNRAFSGILHLSSADDRTVKGLVYSSHDKVLLEQNAFEGKNCTIPYIVKSEGALNGDVIEGVFYIVSNGGELSVPFSFRVEAGSFETSMGTVRNLHQFTELAQHYFDEAVKLFETADFKDVFLGEDLALRCLYDGMIKGADPRNNVEEFLIAIRQKLPVHISIADNNRNYEGIEENFKDTVVIERDTWGYANIQVRCETPFIRLERKFIDSDLFTGNKYEFSYVIEYEKLHNGRNNGRILFETNHGQIQYQLTVVKKDSVVNHDRALTKKLTTDLMTLYIRFRTHAIPVEEWIRESRIVVEALRAIDASSPFYSLALAQLDITERKDEEAKELMELVKDEIHAETAEDYPLYCYFIYVNTLYNKDYAYSKRAASMIRDCYEKVEDWRILWTLLFIDEDLENNPSLKLLRIKEQYNHGSHSPVMYLEACKVLNEHPHLLRVMNQFEASVLYFGAKNHIIEEKLCSQAASLILSMRYGTQRYIRLMWALYQNHKTRELLECLCKILVRNSCVGTQYLDIFGEAIREELKITQLFEYYIMSRKEDDMRPLPKMVLMYFGYNNSLDYRKKAYLYANIIYNKADNPQVYRSYIPQMEKFMMDQLLLGHVSEHLCTLYKELLTPDMLTEENAGPVSEIFFTYQVNCDNPWMRRIIVRHKESNSEREYPIVNGTAYIRMYTDSPAVYLAGDSGNRYFAGSNFNPKRMIDNDEVLKQALIKDPSLIHLKLYYREKNAKYQKQNVESIEQQKSLLSFREFSRSYKKSLTSAIINYYYDSYDEEGFRDFMADENTKKEYFDEKDLAKIIEIYIVQGDYEKAYEMLRGRSIQGILPKRLMKLCSRLAADAKESSEELLRICYAVFSENYYDEVILQYLADYFNGSSDAMLSVWKRAMEAEIDTYDLEERLLAQMMFTHEESGRSTEVFAHYYSRGPKERIVEAYLAYHAYLYFVKGHAVSEDVFDLIEASVENEHHLPMICKMALVYYYSELHEMTSFRKQLATRMIYELARKDYVFPFYLKLQKEVRLPFDIVDKMMIEYRANPKHRIIIHYTIEQKNHKKDYISEDMKQVYDGIFVKQFVLFYGESISYYITEEAKEGKHTMETVRLVNQKVRPDQSDGRYDALNDIIASKEAHDAETFRKLVHSYAVQNYITEQMLTMKP